MALTFFNTSHVFKYESTAIERVDVTVVRVIFCSGKFLKRPVHVFCLKSPPLIGLGKSDNLISIKHAFERK